MLKTKRNDHAGDRTQNLLIRSQTPCHWATRPRSLMRFCCEIGIQDHSLVSFLVHATKFDKTTPVYKQRFMIRTQVLVIAQRLLCCSIRLGTKYT